MLGRVFCCLDSERCYSLPAPAQETWGKRQWLLATRLPCGMSGLSRFRGQEVLRDFFRAPVPYQFGALTDMIAQKSSKRITLTSKHLRKLSIDLRKKYLQSIREHANL